MHKAFSLVELSIVLVILGLLTGGILAGQSLIRAAELRAVSTEQNRYMTAVQNFRDKYFAVPGDMNNATQFWNTATNCPGNSSQGSTDARTCDGNGNGQISYGNLNSTEPFRFWQHLANAGLIEGTYSGVTGDDGYAWTGVDTNSPRSKLGDAIWQVHYVVNRAGGFSASVFYRDFKNTFFLGAPRAGTWNLGGALSPEEAWNIDTKMDDGKPGQGNVTATAGPNCSNAANGATLTTDYALSVSGKRCFMVFGNGF